MKALSSGRRALLAHLGHLTCPFSCSRMVRVSVTSRSHLSQWYSYAGITTPPADWGAEGGSAPVSVRWQEFYRWPQGGVGKRGFPVATSSGHTTTALPSCHWTVIAL